MEKAARILASRCLCKFVLIKVGHLTSTTKSMEVLYDYANDVTHRISGPLLTISSNIHGTGYSLAAAVTANFAKWLSMLDSVKCAKIHVRNGIAHGFKVGKGEINVLYHHQ